MRRNKTSLVRRIRVSKRLDRKLGFTSMLRGCPEGDWRMQRANFSPLVVFFFSRAFFNDMDLAAPTAGSDDDGDDFDRGSDDEDDDEEDMDDEFDLDGEDEEEGAEGVTLDDFENFEMTAAESVFFAFVLMRLMLIPCNYQPEPNRCQPVERKLPSEPPEKSTTPTTKKSPPCQSTDLLPDASTPRLSRDKRRMPLSPS